jgi:hypothetical protein
MKIKVTYLEMFAYPQGAVPPPREGLAVVHAKRPTVAYYRFLYDRVGRDYRRARIPPAGRSAGLVLSSAAPLAEAGSRGYNKLTLGLELRLDAAKKQAFKEAADPAGLAPCRPGSRSG